MTDLATLLLKVDSTAVKTGVKELDNLTSAGKRAEAQTGRIRASHAMAAQGVERFARGMNALVGQQNTATASAARMAAGAGLARHHIQNLTFQVNDLAMALATGQPPMRAFIQQGSQIAQIGQQAGVGLGGMAAAVLRMLAPFSGVIGAAGLLALAFGRVKDEANSADMSAFNASLGLTKQEMEELTDTTITWGDVAQATFDVVAHRAGTSSDEITDFFGSAFKSLGELAKFSAGVLLGAFGAMVKGVVSAITNALKLVANVIGAITNAVITGIETLLNRAISGVNAMAERANSAIKVLPKGVRDTLGIGTFAKLGGATLGRVKGPSFDLSNPLTDAKDQFFKTFNDTQSGFNKIGRRSDELRRDRLRGQARDIIGDRDGGSSGGRAGAHRAVADALNAEQRAYDQALKAAQSYLEGLQGETARIGKTAIEIKQMEVNAAAAKAPTAELAQAIRDAGDAWVAATKAQASADFIKNVVEPLEFENSLLGLNAEAQRIVRAERELTAAGVERGTEAWERYIAAVRAATDAETKKATDKSPLEQWAETVPQTAAQIDTALQGIAVRGLDNLTQGLMDVISGTKSLGDAFGDVARGIIADIIQMTIRMMLFRALSAAFGGGGFGGASFDIPYAKGGVFNNGNVVPFARGGVVHSPTFFPMAGGRTGLMGEAGSEAIMPLARDGRGRLGVRAANDQQRIVVEMTLDNEMLGAKIVQGANAVVEIKRRGIVQEASTQTLRTAGRRKIMGR